MSRYARHNPDEEPNHDWFAGARRITAEARTLWEKRLEARQEADSPFILPSDQNNNSAPAQLTSPQPQPTQDHA